MDHIRTLTFATAFLTAFTAQTAFANPEDINVCVNDLSSEERQAQLKSKGWIETQVPQEALASSYFLGNAGTNASRDKAKDTWAWAIDLAESGPEKDVWLTKDGNFVQIGDNSAANRFCLFIANKVVSPKVLQGLPTAEATSGHAIWRHAGKVQDTSVKLHYATARFEPVFGMTIPNRLTATFLTQ